MSTRTTALPSSETCDIHACNGPRTYQVGKKDNIRGVCARCMEELVTAFGWRLLGGRLREETTAR